MTVLSDFASLLASPGMLGIGWAEHILLPDPGAGVTTVGRVVPGSTWETVHTARATFTADATVGTRNPRLEFVAPDGTLLYAINVSSGVVASTSVVVNLAIGSEYGPAATGISSLGWPFLVAQSGFVTRFADDGVGPADEWTDVVMYVQRYPSNITRVLSGA